MGGVRGASTRRRPVRRKGSSVWRWLICRHQVLASTRATLAPLKRYRATADDARSVSSPPGNSLEPFHCYDLCGQIVQAKKDRKSVMASFLEELHRTKAEAAECDADPLREKVEALVRSMQAISTHSLLDLLGLPKTTGNGRRIAATMRTLGFVPIKSRRLMPGGYRDTVTRGWARPFAKQ